MWKMQINEMKAEIRQQTLFHFLEKYFLLPAFAMIFYIGIHYNGGKRPVH